jgi:hypothetical protein
MGLKTKSVKEKMNDLDNCKNSVGLKPNAEWKKDAKAPSIPISNSSINGLIISIWIKEYLLPIQHLFCMRAL